MADVKGDLAGISAGRRRVAPSSRERLKDDRRRRAGVGRAARSSFWDVFGEQGHPVRATISDMGPLLLGAHARA